MFTLIDWLVLAAYFLAMAGLGFWFSRSNRNFSDYMFGGGSMPWLAVGISLIATSVSASTFLGNPADSYANDLRFLMLNFGSLIAIVVVGVVFIPRFRAAGISSAYELLERRFSRPIRLLAATLYCCHLLLRCGILLYGPALVLKNIFHISLFPSILAMALIATVYTYFGGIKAVTWTDVAQFLIFFGGGLIVIWVCSQQSGGLRETFTLALREGKLRWFDGSFNPASARNFVSAGLVYAVFEIAIRGCDQQFVQRYLSCKNVKEANYSSIASAVLGLLVGLVFFYLGACLFVYYRIQMVEMLPEMPVNDVFPHFILSNLPNGLKGLMVAAIMAAAMSSLSSAFSALSNTVVVDFLGDKKNNSHSLGKAKFWVLVWGLLGCAAGSLCALGQSSLLSMALYFTSLFTGPLLALFILTFFTKKLQSIPVFIGTIAGMLSLTLVTQPPFLDANTWKPLFAFSWPWNPLISFCTSCLVAFMCQIIFDLFSSQHKPNPSTVA